jgi:hypothetical protein
LERVALVVLEGLLVTEMEMQEQAVDRQVLEVF